MEKPKRGNYGKQPNQYINRTKVFSTSHIKSIPGDNESQEEENASTHHAGIVSANQNKWSKADIIAALMLVVTTLLMIFTYQLYSTAAKDSNTADTSAKAANQSAITAQQTLNEIKRYNTQSLAKQQTALDKADKNNQDNFGRIDKSLSIQDSSFKETRQEFLEINEPYLEIEACKIDTLIMGKPIQVSSILNNLGNYPVKVLSSKIGTSIRFSNPGYNAGMDGTNTDIINDYIVKNGNKGFSSATLKNITPGQYNGVMFDKYFVWIFGIITYQNIITKAIKEYRFSFKIKPNNFGVAVDNDNVIIKK